jgi:hypothetical protein
MLRYGYESGDRGYESMARWRFQTAIEVSMVSPESLELLN